MHIAYAMNSLYILMIKFYTPVLLFHLSYQLAIFGVFVNVLLN